MQKFFICKHCGNLIGMLHDSGARIVCCGEPMHELTANTVDAAVEKHLPAVETVENEVRVKVGSIDHPMAPEHHIEWIYLETTQGGQRKALNVGELPAASFTLCGEDKPVAVFAYCNLHGLWKTEF